MSDTGVTASAQKRVMKYVPVTLGGIEYEFRKPTTAQFLIFAGSLEGAQKHATLIMPALEKMLKRTSATKKQFKEIWERIEEGELDLEDLVLNDDSLLARLGESLAEHPTQSSGESSSNSSGKAGKRSTGRSPGKGSTLSA